MTTQEIIETIAAYFCGAWIFIFLVYLFIRAFSKAQYGKRQNTEIYDSEIKDRFISTKKEKL
jgi:hypothetical protein